LVEVVPANFPRFDHDPVTGECLGLMIEEQRTNLVLNSLSGYQNLYPANTTVTTGIDAPDGSNNAVRITCSTSGPTLIRMNTGTLSNSTTYSGSFYVRLISGDTATNNQLTSDICDGASINYLPLLITNKWVRITYSGFRGLTNNPEFNFIDLLSDRTNNYVLDFWGSQVEASKDASSYIPTSGSTVTRNSDNVWMNNISNFFNPNEGTVIITYRPIFNGVYNSPFNALFAIRNSAGRNIGFTGNSNNSQLYFTDYTNLIQNDGGTFTWLYPSGASPSTQRSERVLVSYANTYFRMYQDAIPFNSTNTLYGAGKISDFIPSAVGISTLGFDAITFGNIATSNTNTKFNHIIQQFVYYPSEVGVSNARTLSKKS
jgi:hypothetical protein